MQVVLAVPEDARSVAQIHVETWRVAYATLLSSDFLDSLCVDTRETMWSQCIASGSPVLLVAKEAGVVHGLLSFGASRDKGASASEAEIWALYVAPRWWSTGAGRVLWLHAKSRMLEQHYMSCSLWVFQQNARAVKFYEAAGFVRDPSPPKSVELGGRQLIEVRYVCQFDSESGSAARPL